MYRRKFRPSAADAGPEETGRAGGIRRRRRLFGAGRQFETGAMTEGERCRYPDPGRFTQPYRPPHTCPQHDPPDRSGGGSRWEVGIEGRHHPDRIRDQVRRGTNHGDQVGGGGTLFTEPVLVVNQRAKLIELGAEFAVYDQHGQQIGSVVQVGQSIMKKVARFAGRLDQFFTHTLEVRDVAGRVLLRLTRPRKMVKSRIVVERGDGQPVGEIKQDNVFGSITFTFSSGDVPVGAIRAENVLAWHFSVVDESGTEVARISKTWAGWDRAVLTNADKYVVQIPRRLPEPLAALVVAASLSIDLALKQDDNGLSLTDLLPW